ncbi:MAG: 6-phosphofructokinase [Candidatus Omnitrophota bacterium]
MISGGDDTGSVIVDLHNNGIACVHAPKTMDLDLQPYSVGGDSTINRIATFVSDLKTTGVTHNRIMVTEVFGRYAGHSALRGGVTAEADCILIPEIPVDFDFVYKHMKFRYMRRVEKSDVNAGTYTIVVAEGITDAEGKNITDDGVGVDAFGHKKLAGAGKYVCNVLTKRLKKDDEIKEFMKEQKLFVEGLYEVPEIRHVMPGHLVRCGAASAYDVNFGKEAGAGAVRLLAEGITGVTVVKVDGNHISYMDTHEAIKQRHVDLEHVALYEQLGVCFGRIPVDYKPDFIRVSGRVDRIY